MTSIKIIQLSVTVLFVSFFQYEVTAQYYHHNHNYGPVAASSPHGQQQLPVASHSHPQFAGHRVAAEEKDYGMDGAWSPWLLLYPVIFLPLILLLCTPLFHSPGQAHYGDIYGAGPSHGIGYGGGGPGFGHKRSFPGQSEILETTGKVLQGISRKA